MCTRQHRQGDAELSRRFDCFWVIIVVFYTDKDLVRRYMFTGSSEGLNQDIILESGILVGCFYLLPSLCSGSDHVHTHTQTHTHTPNTHAGEAQRMSRSSCLFSSPVRRSSLFQDNSRKFGSWLNRQSRWLTLTWGVFSAAQEHTSDSVGHLWSSVSQGGSEGRGSPLWSRC